MKVFGARSEGAVGEHVCRGSGRRHGAHLLLGAESTQYTVYHSTVSRATSFGGGGRERKRPLHS
jgi:hypothetical protein